MHILGRRFSDKVEAALAAALGWAFFFGFIWFVLWPLWRMLGGR